MAEEPDNLVLKMLREIRVVIDEVREKVFEHDERFAEIKKSIEDWQETTSTGTGLAMHASLRSQAMEREIEELKRRVALLERAH